MIAAGQNKISKRMNIPTEKFGLLLADWLVPDDGVGEEYEEVKRFTFGAT